MTKTPNFFTDNSPFLQHPLLTDARTAHEVEFVVQRLALTAGAKVLDVGCGFGRHSVALAQRGLDVVGIDPAAAMIAAAQQKARNAGAFVTFKQIPAEQFESDESFDAAICLFTTLGQISETGKNSGLVQCVYDALKPDGRFLVEVPQRETAVSQLKPSDKFGDGERYTAVTRQYDKSDHSVTETFALVSPEKTHNFVLRYRLYTQETLAQLLEQAGFTIEAWFSDYDGSPLSAESATMLALCQKC